MPAYAWEKMPLLGGQSPYLVPGLVKGVQAGFHLYSSLWLDTLRHVQTSPLYAVTLCFSDVLTDVWGSSLPPLWFILSSIVGLLFLQFCSHHCPTTRTPVVPTAVWMHFKLLDVAMNVLHHLAFTCPSSFISWCSLTQTLCHGATLFFLFSQSSQ